MSHSESSYTLGSYGTRRSREADVFNYSVVIEDEHRLYTCSEDFQRKIKGKDGRMMKGQITTKYKHKYKPKG